MDELVLGNLWVRDGSGRALVEDVDLALRAGELLGVVGASGSGKSLTARALVGLVPEGLAVDCTLRVPTAAGPAQPYAGPPRDWGRLRGSVVGLLPQDAGQSLDPFRTVAAQLRVAGRGGHPPDAVHRALRDAGFREPEAVGPRYPHELSGGMAQRVALAKLLVVGARFLICDEPTTGLDAAVQRALMGSLSQLAAGGRGVLVVSHALRWLHRGADRVVVFSAGRVAERVRRGDPFTSEPGRRLVAAVQHTVSPGFPDEGAP